MASLYELTTQRLALQNKLEELNFDVDTITDTILGESTELEAKIVDYGYILRNRSGLEAMMLAEVERMQARYNAHEKRTEAIKAWLLQNMQACQISRIDCPAFSVSLKNNPPKVVIDAESLIPDKYMRTPTPKPPMAAPDKKAIGDAIKQGEEVPGCHSEQSQRLVIE